MTEENREQQTISRKSRLYASVLFLITFVGVATFWMIFFATYFQPNENTIILLILFLVLGGLAVLPWLPVVFQREPPGGPPLEDL
jgi:hypothetical protein